jgi:amidase
MNDLVFRTARELAAAIQDGEVSSMEVVDAHLARIVEHNPKLNAIVTLDEAGARQRAREADEALVRGEVWGPLHGVPVTIKDSFETAGLRTTSSYKPLADHVPERDATAVARLRRAGAIVLGKSNMPQLAGDNQSNSPLFGVANNPWDLARTPGGSSGGEAAAIAAGLSPLGLGSDIGGSIRIPAHFCGVFGLKPTDHRVPGTGHIPPLPGAINSVRHMPVYGPLARSVADLRLSLSLIAGPDGRDSGVPPLPLEEVPRRSLADLRFAWSDDFGGIPVSADTRTALADLAARLESAGCHIERRNPPDFDFALAWQTYGELYGAMVYTLMPPLVRTFMHLAGPLMFKDPIFRSATRRARASAPQYFAALTQRDQLLAAMERFLAGYDAWLCPVASIPAFAHRKPDRLELPLEVDGQSVPGVFAGLAHTLLFNLTGHPVVVVPLAQSKEGLPIGVQVAGPLWNEMALLNVAEALEEVTGPFRWPPGFGSG